MGKIAKWTRRGFIAAGGLVGGGLALGIAFAPNRLRIKGDDKALNTWVKITPDNRVAVLVPHCDMGQGSQTGLAMMLAEEMDADWSLVGVQEAPALPAYANEYLVRGMLLGTAPPLILGREVDDAVLGLTALMGLQVTGGSASIRFTGELGLRTAGAAARAMLIQAAATRWGVSTDACSAERSTVRHEASGRVLSFGALAEDAASLPPPEAPALKPFAAWRIVGTSPPRFDVPAKVDGSAHYAVDVALPGMLYAAVTAAPVFGGKLLSVESASVEKMPGVHSVVRLDNAVAVVATGYWQALTGLNALKPVFDDGGHGHVSSTEIETAQSALLAKGPGSTDVKRGDAASALASAAHVVTADYAVPYLAHATLEPPNATVHIVGEKCEIWTGVQDPLNARATAARATGLPRENVTVHNCVVGGGFGRKIPDVMDFIEQAAKIGRAVAPRPVKLIWSREEDISHDYYRTAARARFQGGLNAQGKPVVWRADYTGDAGERAAHLPYQIDNQLITGWKYANHVRTGAWRSVDHSQHGFFSEGFVDELANAAGRDAFQFRRDLLPAGSRHLAVLNMAAEKSGWGSALPAGCGRGIALTEAFGSIVAEVAEVAVSPTGAVQVRRVTAVVDCGDLVHPDAATAQIEGGIMFGLAAALYGEITIENGAVSQRNFDTYQVARMADAPAIEVYFIASHAQRGGIGEVGVPAIAPAVANAIHAACGVRMRKLPLRSVALAAGPAPNQHASAL
jgi:isoquinoline 1-oxidoreductase beta subunit